MSHTPGPWTASPHAWPEQIGCCPLPGRPYSVSVGQCRNVAAALTLDDARLIAAAPVLLEALQELADYVDERSDDNECRPLENARYAIRKATETL